ncbi:MAG: hypothetical protein COA43_03555 [Robiginitomaculum sp.]|nr:MAG: hypothetical protein COA43_03555 [Robiginitomaculum sp.]
MSAAPVSPACKFIRRFRHDEPLWSGRFSTDGTRIVVQDTSFTKTGDDYCNREYIWDIQTGDMLYGGSIAPRGCAVKCDYYVPEAADDDLVQRVFKVGSSHPVLEFEGRIWFDASPHLAVLHKEPYKLANGSILYKSRQLYNFESGNIICDLDFLSQIQLIKELSYDGAYLLCSTEKSNEMSVWDIMARKRIAHLAPSDKRAIKGHLDSIRRAMFLPGRRDRVMTITNPRVYSDGLDPMAAIIWDVPTAQPIAQVLCGGDRTLAPSPHCNACDIGSFAFASNGTWIAALRADGYTGPTETKMRVFHTHTGDEVAQFEIGQMPHHIAGAPNAPYVAATTFQSPVVRIFEIGSNQEIAHCSAPAFMSDTPTTDVAFAPSSPDGQYILTTHEDGDAVLWRMPHWV